MKNVITIMKKELKRFFTDPRMLISLILPGVIIFVCYSLMGNILNKSINNEEYQYQVCMINQPEEYKIIDNSSQYKIEVNSVEASEIDNLKERLANKEFDLLISYEDGFIDKIANGEKPNISIYYNSTSDESQEIYYYYLGALSYGSSEVNYKYYVNGDTNATYDLATKEDVSKQIITMMIPYIMVIFLFTGCMAVTTESIAGEKERGTIATLLVTPTKRSEIAIGKILALSITSLVSAAVSFIGVMLSLPKMMSGFGAFTISMYGVGEYALLFFIILTCIIFYTVVLSLISTLAKSVKEASQYAMPIMVISMLIGLTSLTSYGAVPTNPFVYLLPIYNIVSSMSSVFALKISVLNIFLTFASNIIYIGIGVFVLTKFFNNERIMFNK